MSQLSIRQATTTDAPLILHFIRELAIYEKAEHEVQATELSIKQSIFAEGSHVNALIC
jgi:hypothetical protein